MHLPSCTYRLYWKMTWSTQPAYQCSYTLFDLLTDNQSRINYSVHRIRRRSRLQALKQGSKMNAIFIGHIWSRKTLDKQIPSMMEEATIIFTHTAQHNGTSLLRWRWLSTACCRSMQNPRLVCLTTRKQMRFCRMYRGIKSSDKCATPSWNDKLRSDNHSIFSLEHKKQRYGSYNLHRTTIFHFNCMVLDEEGSWFFFYLGAKADVWKDGYTYILDSQLLAILKDALH